MNERLTLQDLTELLAEEREMTKKDADLFLRELVDLISETIEKNEIVRIKDFGTFKLVKINARKSVNVNTGESIEIASHYRLTFSPDKSLRDTVNRPFAHFDSVLLADGIDFDTTTMFPKDNDLGIDADEEEKEIILEEIEKDEKEVVEKEVVEKESSNTEKVSETITPTDLYSSERMKENISNVLDRKDNQIEKSFEAEKENNSDEEKEGIEKILDYQPPIIIVEKEKRDEKENIKEEKSEQEIEKPLIIPVLEEEETAKEEKIEEEKVILQSTNNKEENDLIINSNKQREMDEKEKEPIEDFTEEVTNNTNELSNSNNYSDNDYYYEESSNKKYYIILGVLLALAIGLFIYSRYSRNVDDAKPVEIEAVEPIPTETLEEEKEEEIVEEKVVDKADLGVEVVDYGQTLRLISLKYYGHKSFWVYIYEVNKSKISNPNNVGVGTKLTIPSLAQFNVDPTDSKEIAKAKRMESELYTRLGQ